MEHLFTMVNNFDKVEGYDQWLASQVQPKGLPVVEEESSDEPAEENISKPYKTKTVPKIQTVESTNVLDYTKRSVLKIEHFIIE